MKAIRKMHLGGNTWLVELDGALVIATYNEQGEVVRASIYGCKQLDKHRKEFWA